MKKDGPSALVLINKKERINGWSWPPHPYQLIAWFFLVALPLVYYGTLVSHLPKSWIPAGCIIPGAFLLVHLIFHLVCVTLDPADPKIRAQKTEKATQFSREQHKHVIENDHCYICQVDVGRRSKHCALCNKCISHFDHHCKWLNNCIGGQNYKLFICCITTALASALSLSAFCLYLFIMYFKDREMLLGQKEWEIFGDLDSQTLMSVIGIMMILLLLAIILLGHLLCFHIFLMFKHLSTYDFIVQNRQAISNKPSDTDSTSVVRPPKLQPCKANKISHYPAESVHNESIEMKKKNSQNSCRIEINGDVT